MVADFYINGEKSVTASSLRFLTHDRENYFLGASPLGKNPFVGRIYYFMIVDYELSEKTIQAVYKGDIATVEKIKSHAEVVMGTNTFDISPSHSVVYNKQLS